MRFIIDNELKNRALGELVNIRRHLPHYQSVPEDTIREHADHLLLSTLSGIVNHLERHPRTMTPAPHGFEHLLKNDRLSPSVRANMEATIRSSQEVRQRSIETMYATQRQGLINLLVADGVSDETAREIVDSFIAQATVQA